MRSLVLCLALLFGAGPAPAQGLDRLTQRTDLFGWEAVGRLDIGRGFCTAVLVAPDLLLTAAHCLFDEGAEDWRPVSEMTFHAGLRDGEAIASRNIARAVVMPGYDPSAAQSILSVRQDVGLLQLANPVPATTAAPFGVTGIGRTGAQVTMLSYGQDRSNALSREAGCRTVARDFHVAALDCSAEPGSSGAPVFDTNGRHPRIMALVSGGSTLGDREIVVGVGAARSLAVLQDRLRRGDGVWPKPTTTARRILREAPRTAGQARFLRP